MVRLTIPIPKRNIGWINWPLGGLYFRFVTTCFRILLISGQNRFLQYSLTAHHCLVRLSLGNFMRTAGFFYFRAESCIGSITASQANEWENIFPNAIG